jgi:hypothetical protein
MTVAEAGKKDGILQEVAVESGLDTDAPHITFSVFIGTLNSDLTIGADIASLPSLRANEGICSRAVSDHSAS